MKRITAFVLVLLLTLTLLPTAAFAAWPSETIKADNLELLNYWSGGVKECGYTASSGDIRVKLLIHVPQEQKDGHFTRTQIETDNATSCHIQTGSDNVKDRQKITDGNVTVRTSKGVTTITGTLTVESGKVYTVSLSGSTVRNDRKTSDFEHDFIVDEALVDNSKFLSEKQIDVLAENYETDETIKIKLTFNTSIADPLMIPVGIYPIEPGGRCGTVLASVGIEKGEPQASYTADGSAYWFLQSGTVTVRHRLGKLILTVNGENSNGRTVKSTIEAAPGNYLGVYTALEAAKLAGDLSRYTDTSAAVLKAALGNVEYALSSYEQGEINWIASELGKAVAGLESKTLYAAAVRGAEAAVKAAAGVNPSTAVKGMTASALAAIRSADTVAAVKTAQYQWVASIGKQVSADLSGSTAAAINALLGRVFR